VKAGDFMTLVKDATASAQTLRHFASSSLIELGGGVPSHTKHFQLTILPSLSRVTHKDPLAAQGIIPRYSKAVRRSASFNSAKQSLQSIRDKAAIRSDEPTGQLDQSHPDP
jgi:hypothetical protein